jgi:hypothetical protein
VPANHDDADAPYCHTDVLDEEISPKRGRFQQPAAAEHVAAWRCGPRERGKLIESSSRVPPAKCGDRRRHRWATNDTSA